MQTAVFVVFTLCSLVTLMMEAEKKSETSVNFCQTTWSKKPKDAQHHTNRRENVESQ